MNIFSYFHQTSDQFIKDLKNRTRNAKTYASFAYDAVWTLALALNKALKTTDLSKFSYTQQKTAATISKFLQDVKFEAVSVSSDFMKSVRCCSLNPIVTGLQWECKSGEGCFRPASIKIDPDKPEG